MKKFYRANRAWVLFAALATVCPAGVTRLDAAGATPRYDVTFGQEGHEVRVQVVPARLGIATSAMPAPDDPAVTAIVGAPVARPTAAVPPKSAGSPIQLKSQSIADYKEDGFEASLDDIAGESISSDLDASGKLSLAILFDNDARAVDLSDSLTVKTLNNVLKMMNLRPTLKISVEGFVDYTGVKEYQALGLAPDGGQAASEDRAYAVKKWLVDKGISTLRISSVGKGTRGADGDSMEQRSLNRRVDIVKVSE